MVDPIPVLAVGLVVAGVVGTIVPLVPGGALSLSGVYLHWWASGYTEPGLIALAVLSVLGVTTLLVEFLAGALSARVGGASWRTTGVAVIVGTGLAIVAGPLGLVVGLFATVFALEFADRSALSRSLRAAAYATVGVLLSTAVQVALTTTMLLVFLGAIFVF